MATGGAEAELERLALRVLQPGFEGTEAPDWLRRRMADGLGSVLLFARNIAGPRQTAALTASLRSENPDVVVAVDEEGGDVTRLDAAVGSAYPGNLALGAVDDAELTEAVGHALGRRLAAAGIGLDYAPDADVNSNPRNPVIGVRSFGAETALVARHVKAWVRGLQRAGVGACAKHFPGHGDTDLDSHFALPSVHASLEQLAATALPPFAAAIEAGARAVMLGHLLVPSLDPNFPASVSRLVVGELLRGRLGFRGLIVTDAMEMRAIADRYGLEHAAVLALRAGADLVCTGQAGDDALVRRLSAAICDAVACGELPESRLIEAAESVGRFAQWSAQAAQWSAQSADADSDEGIGLTAACRALRVIVRDEGALPLTRAPYVVSFTTQGPAALGSITEGSLAGQLALILPGTERAVLGDAAPERLARILAEAAGRPLVLAVRSAHRHPWMLDALGRLLAGRPDAVVVELGLPGRQRPGRDATLGAAAYLTTFGASRACARAAAGALAGPGVCGP